MHHLNSPQRKHAYAWITTRETMDYRNKLSLPEMDARTCRRGANVTSLRIGGEVSSASPPIARCQVDQMGGGKPQPILSSSVAWGGVP
jgi:hypothetical protein